MKLTKYNLKILICGLLSIVFFGVYHQYVPINSDNTTLLPMSSDLINGNLLLNDWVLGTNNFYFTEIVIYALGKLLGFKNSVLLYWIPAIAWTILYFSTLKFLQSEIIQFSNDKKYTFLLFSFAVLLIVAPTSSIVFLNANFHINLYLFLIIYFLLVEKYLEKEQIKYLITPTILGIFMQFSEGVTTMILIIPVICFCLIHILKKEKKYLFLMVSTVISYIFAKLIFKFFEICDGMYTKGLPINLVDLKTIPNRFIEWINQFSIPLGIDTYFTLNWCFKKVIVTILIFLFIVSLFYYLINLFNISWKKQLLLITVGVNIAACIFTDVVCTYRYLVIGYYFGFFLTGLFIIDMSNKIKNKKISIINISLITLLLINFVSTKFIDIFNQEKKNLDTKELANLIIQNNLGDGYADYWCGSVVSFYTNYNNKILPVLVRDNTGIIKYDELIKRSWYDTKNIHYVITHADGGSVFIDNEALFKLCGEPQMQYNVGSYVLYYWNDDLSQYINNGLDDMILTPNELYQNEYVEIFDDKEILYPNGIVFGPYEDLDAGTYTINIFGENMDKLHFDVWSNSKNKSYKIIVKKQTSSNIIFDVELIENVYDIEFRLFNNTDEQLSYSLITIEEK